MEKNSSKLELVESNILHTQCYDCIHLDIMKTFKITMIDTPCHLCLFNAMMIKTNNYETITQPLRNA